MPVQIPNIEKRYFKLPFILMNSEVTQNKIEKPCKRFCKNAKVKLVFASDNLHWAFSYKDSYPSVLSSKVVYKFVCASCNASYVGQTHWHLTTRIDEHLTLKGIVKRVEPCQCDILLVSKILWHKRITPSLKEWRFSYLILTGAVLS